MVQTAKRSFEDPDVLTVLLTGRSTAYIDLITRILESKDLHFDLVVLKPKKGRGESNSTLTFKYSFIDAILHLGESIDEVDIYEDRAPHRDAFENYLKNWRRVKDTMEEDDGIKMESVELEKDPEERLKAFKVHFVEMPFIYLDEAVEESLIRNMLEETNKTDMADDPDEYVLEKQVFNLGYAVESADFERLFETYFNQSMEESPSDRHEWRRIRQPSVFIHFNVAPHILNRVGGYGKQVEFEITHLGISDKVLALSLTPTASFHQTIDESGNTVLQKDSRLRYWSKNEIPVLVLATRNGGKPIDANYLKTWTAIPPSIENRRFLGRVAAKQEISIKQVSKEEAKVRKEAEQAQNTPPHKRHSPRMGRVKPEGENRNSVPHGRSVYGERSTRNAFGYSLE